jgi:nitrite reductase (cytochrome c-552)
MEKDGLSSQRPRTLLVLVLAAALAGAGALLYRNGRNCPEEAGSPAAETIDWVEDREAWGKKHPLQYESYLRTVDQVRTRFAGSELIARIPDDEDPRPFVSQSKLEEDPRLAQLWSGYPYARDFRESRGHAYMLDDLLYAARTGDLPGSCLSCHASVAGKARHPVACIDCHDPATMALRVTRSAFIEGMTALKASEGVRDYDVNRDASRQEMRSFVCGQCHSEYYLKGPDRQPAMPWAKGLKIEDIYEYYDESGYSDWKHAQTGAEVLKAQHPEFEMWSQGVHAKSGVACADCHMPYSRQGPKYSDHHVRSPLLNINRSCHACHRWAAEEGRRRAESFQERTSLLKDQAVEALVELLEDLKTARAAGRKEPAQAQECQRRAQFYLDFVEAENSAGMHAFQEAERILNESIRHSRLGREALR